MIDMKGRAKKFTIDCALLCSKLLNYREYNAYVNQLIRCWSSVGANYRASQRAKSTADFINKLKILITLFINLNDLSLYYLSL